MKKVRKLTPATLRRIIAEERLKIKKELLKNSSKSIKSKNSEDLLSEIKKLIRLKKAQKRSVNQLKKIHEARRTIKRKLLKRL
jgi:hypothetical protein